MDPRFKLTHVNDRAGILKEIEMQIVEEIDTDVTAISAESMKGRPDSLSSEGVPPPNKKLKGLSKVLSRCFVDLAVQQQLSPQQKVKQEIDQYLTHPQLDISGDTLEWWKFESVRYPILAKLHESTCAYVPPVYHLSMYSVVGVTQ